MAETRTKQGGLFFTLPRMHHTSAPARSRSRNCTLALIRYGSKFEQPNPSGMVARVYQLDLG